MNTTAEKRIKDLHDGKIVRIFNYNFYYKICPMETMAAIVMIPDPAEGHDYYVSNITLTGQCSMYEAEQLIRLLSD